MNYAIYYPNSNMIARTSKGNFHIYASKEKAEEVAKELGEGYTVKPWNEG